MLKRFQYCPNSQVELEWRILMHEKCHRSEVYEVAIRFARMWGVMETLEPLPFISFEKLYDILMAWAEEFDVGGENDFVGFFIKKSSELKRRMG